MRKVLRVGCVSTGEVLLILVLVIVGWAAEILVDHRRRGHEGWRGEGELVKPVVEDRGDAAASGGVKSEGALTGGFEPCGAVAFDEVEQA